MSQEFQQHWLSAYLDNELSSDERALVERRLEEDADARQLLDDLKRVRGLVATLPGWPGANFQFDMSRLSEGELADDDESDELGPSQTSPTIGHESGVVDSAVVKESANGSKKPSTGMSTAAWRGVLSLAAGLLLLILCVPLFWQREAGTFAIGARSAVPESSVAPGGSMMGGTGNAAVPDSLGDRSAVVFESLADAPAPDAPAAAAAAPAAPAAPAPFNVPTDPGFARGGRGASAPPGPSRAAAPTPKVDGGLGAAGGLRGATPAPMQRERAVEPSQELALTESLPADAAINSGSPLNNSFMCAKSDAWSEAEVKQTLPELLTYVSEKRSLVELTEVAQEKANLNDKVSASAKSMDKPAENNFAKVPATLNKNEVVYNELPNSADVNSWFMQIQTAQPLTQLQLTPEMRLKGKDVQDEDKLAESTQSRLGRSVAPATASPDAKAESSAARSSPESFGNTIPFDPAQAKTEANSQGRIILFVTEAEARKILSTLFPSKPRGPAEQSSGEKKVIVILNR